MALARGGGRKEHAVLAHLLTEPAPSTPGPLDATLEFGPDDERELAAATAYDAAPDCAERWIPGAPAPGRRSALA
jgi:hypothetical protein